MEVIKRDGSRQRYDSRKIEQAVKKAGGDGTAVANAALREITGKDEVTVQDLHRIVENQLMKIDPDSARRYIEYRSERDRERAARQKPDPGAISGYIHAAKYAKFTGTRRETFLETVARSEKMHSDRWPELADEIHAAFEFVRQKKVLPSMRSMQFAGYAIERHNARMYNCSFTFADRPRVFAEIFYLLLCGCGVGFSVQTHHVEAIPELVPIDRSRVYHHHVEDSIEGWADAVDRLFHSVTQGYHVEFDYSQIRPEGAPLNAGGKAPGHIPLRDCLETLREFWSHPRKLRPIEVCDSICHIAEAVLAGGIRRSSLICLFSPEDSEMMEAKAPANFEWTGKNKQRAMANNSAVFVRGRYDQTKFKEVVRRARTEFEPGFFLTPSTEYGTNPCGEIGLDPVRLGRTGFGFCNLTEVNVAACRDHAEFFGACRAAAFIGTLQAAYTDFKYIETETASRDALLGVSLTGIMDNPEIGLSPAALQPAARICVEENRVIAERIGIPPARRITCVKPSGTASLEFGGVSSGIHPQHARRFFRRVTANKNEPIAKAFREINPHMVFDKSRTDWSITFPIQVPDDAITLKDISGQEFMDAVATVYDHWVKPGTRFGKLTHNVSCTVALEEDEEFTVDASRVAAMSFAPKGNDRLPFMPRQAVATEEDEALWRRLIREYTPVPYDELQEDEDGTVHVLAAACAGGQCEIEHASSASTADGGQYFKDVPEGYTVIAKLGDLSWARPSPKS